MNIYDEFATLADQAPAVALVASPAFGSDSRTYRHDPAPYILEGLFQSIVRHIAVATDAQGGTTWSLLFGCQSGSISPAFAVALDNCPPLLVVDTLHSLELALNKYIFEHVDLLLDPRVCIGTWRQSTYVEINTAVVVTNLEDALRLAVERGQEYVFCLQADVPGHLCEIKVGDGHRLSLRPAQECLADFEQISPLTCHVVLQPAAKAIFDHSFSRTPG